MNSIVFVSQRNRLPSIFINVCILNFWYLHKHISLCLSPKGVDRDYGTPIATILTYLFRFINSYQIFQVSFNIDMYAQIPIIYNFILYISGSMQHCSCLWSGMDTTPVTSSVFISVHSMWWLKTFTTSSIIKMLQDRWEYIFLTCYCS